MVCGEMETRTYLNFIEVLQARKLELRLTTAQSE
jgi:hypothetical protein